MALDPKLTQAVYTRDKFKCRHCKNRNGIHAHHVLFKSHGGKDEMNNLITLCAECHLVGIHEGKLLLDVIAVLDNEVVVKFVRKDGWIPRG